MERLQSAQDERPSPRIAHAEMSELLELIRKEALEPEAITTADVAEATGIDEERVRGLLGRVREQRQGVERRKKKRLRVVLASLAASVAVVCFPFWPHSEDHPPITFERTATTDGEHIDVYYRYHAPSLLRLLIGPDIGVWDGKPTAWDASRDRHERFVRDASGWRYANEYEGGVEVKAGELTRQGLTTLHQRFFVPRVRTGLPVTELIQASRIDGYPVGIDIPIDGQP